MMPPNRTVLIILLKLCVCTHFSYLLFLQRIFSSTMLNRNGIPLSSWSGVTFSSFIIIYDAIYLVFVFSKNPETGCGSPLLFSVCWGFFFFFSVMGGLWIRSIAFSGCTEQVMVGTPPLYESAFLTLAFSWINLTWLGTAFFGYASGLHLVITGNVSTYIHKG